MKLFVEQIIGQAVTSLFGEHVTAATNFSVTEPPSEDLGDYATNAALLLAKPLKRNPREISETLAAKILELDTDNDFSEVKSSGGFVNLSFSSKGLLKNLTAILDQRDLYGASVIGGGKKIMFEYSSPNTNKPLHIGHTRNDVYGAACINLLRLLGYKVISCEIINDRGIHIMKSALMYMKRGNGETPNSTSTKPDHFVGKFYTMFAQESAQNPEAEVKLLEEAQELLVKWEKGDEEVRKIWQQMNDWFYAGVKETYLKEGTTFDEVDFESQIYDKGRELVLSGVDSGVFQKEADGSVSVDLAAEGLDKKYLLRKDGTTIYITQDLYLWNLRNERHKPDIAYVTTAAEQSYHFAVLSKLFKLLEFPWAENFRHLPYEHVYLGKNKMSSREGNSISADELLKIVKSRISEVMKATKHSKALPNEESLVEDLAFGAIKYGYLKYEPNTRIYFDLDQTISIDGNTGPYIQYAHARMASILKKVPGVSTSVSIAKIPDSDRMLLRQLLYYSDAILMSAKELKPNLLCNYLFVLAQTFNTFYEQSPVIGESDQSVKDFRVQLIEATSQIIRNGLAALGIHAPEEM